jgi:hypothetical protein
LVAGCGLVSFDVTEKVEAQTIPGSSAVGNSSASVFETTMVLTEESLPKGSGLIESVTLSSVSFQVLSPDNATFEFVDTVKLMISSPSNVHLHEVEIAEGKSVPGQRTLTLRPTRDANLLPYVKAGAQVRAVAVGRPPVENVTFDGKVVLTVHL